MRDRGVLLTMLGLLFLLPGCTGGKICQIPDQSLQIGRGNKQGRLQDQGNGTCLDSQTGKLWQVAKSKRIKSLEEAGKYIDGIQLAGLSDWRLPTVAELYELFLLFDAHGKGDCRMDFKGNYWSGDTDSKGRVGAWELDGDCHPEREYVPKKAGYVRAIRP
ncbi:MAG: DUF1566 domain-containing protein [Thermodesulfobacteriota bacterium]